jgi:hypothetical protein
VKKKIWCALRELKCKEYHAEDIRVSCQETFEYLFGMLMYAGIVISLAIGAFAISRHMYRWGALQGISIAGAILALVYLIPMNQTPVPEIHMMPLPSEQDAQARNNSRPKGDGRGGSQGKVPPSNVKKRGARTKRGKAERIDEKCPNPFIKVDSKTASTDPRTGSKSFPAVTKKFKIAGRKKLVLRETEATEGAQQIDHNQTMMQMSVGHATKVFLAIHPQVTTGVAMPLKLPPELKTCSTTNGGVAGTAVDERMVGADDADRSGDGTGGDGADDESTPSVPMVKIRIEMDHVQDQTDLLVKAAEGWGAPDNDDEPAAKEPAAAAESACALLGDGNVKDTNASTAPSVPASITAFPGIVPAAVLALLALPLSVSEHASRKQLMRQKRKREQSILKCKDGKLLSKPFEEIKISADASATADEDADEASSNADDVSNPDEEEYAVDAAEYIKTTAEVVTWLVPPPALPPERKSIPTAWIDAGVRGYTNEMQEATEAVGTTREGGLYSAEAQLHQGNKEYTATESIPPIMAGGQDTDSDGHATTYSKVGSDERTAAGDDPRKLDIGGTTSDTEVAADDESTVHGGTDESVPDYSTTTGATGDEKGVLYRETCFQRRPMDRAPEARDALPCAAVFRP